MTEAAVVRIAVRLTPRAGSDRIDGPTGGVLQARVHAPPVAGAANEALRRLVAGELGVPVSKVALVSGERTRRKVLEIEGVSRSQVEERWPGLGP